MKRFKNILFVADGDSEVAGALQRAVALADANGARLTVMDVLDPVDTPKAVLERLGVDLAAILRDRRAETLETLVRPLAADDSLIYTKVVFGTPFVEVVRAVRQGGFDLVVKAARSPAGISERLFGSTDMHLLRKCPCPVWIDPVVGPPHYRTVLAAVDPSAPGGDGCDELVMQLACSLADRESARLVVVHAWQLDGESMLRQGRFRLPEADLDSLLRGTEQRHRERLDALLTAFGMRSTDDRVHLVKGLPAAAIHRIGEEQGADVIVMGTVGRGGIPGFFIGNTAEEVLQTAKAAVLAVKPAGFVSPVE